MIDTVMDGTRMLPEAQMVPSAAVASEVLQDGGGLYGGEYEWDGGGYVYQAQSHAERGDGYFKGGMGVSGGGGVDVSSQSHSGSSASTSIITTATGANNFVKDPSAAWPSSLHSHSHSQDYLHHFSQSPSIEHHQQSSWAPMTSSSDSSHFTSEMPTSLVVDANAGYVDAGQYDANNMDEGGYYGYEHSVRCFFAALAFADQCCPWTQQATDAHCTLFSLATSTTPSYYYYSPIPSYTMPSSIPRLLVRPPMTIRSYTTRLPMVLTLLRTQSLRKRPYARTMSS